MQRPNLVRDPRTLFPQPGQLMPRSPSRRSRLIPLALGCLVSVATAPTSRARPTARPLPLRQIHGACTTVTRGFRRRQFHHLGRHREESVDVLCTERPALRRAPRRVERRLRRHRAGHGVRALGLERGGHLGQARRERSAVIAAALWQHLARCRHHWHAGDRFLEE